MSTSIKAPERLEASGEPDQHHAKLNNGEKKKSYEASREEKHHRSGDQPPRQGTQADRSGGTNGEHYCWPRASAKKLKVEKQGDSFVTEKLPAGAPYAVIMQVKEKPDAKAMTLRLNYDPKPSASGKPAYIDDSVNEGSGPSIAVPETIDGLFGEINQHHAELKDGFKKKSYEALDEVTQAFTVLLKGLPAKSGDKQAAVAPQVDALVKDLAAIGEANAARQLPDAAKNLERFNSGIAALKKNYPAKTANAKL